MNTTIQDGQTMPENLKTYMEKFNPTHIDVPIGELVPMPQNEEINGPLQLDADHKLLKKSMEMFGQRKPVVTFKDEETTYIIDGVRVVEAGKEAGLTEITCVMLDVTKELAFEIMQILNSGQRRVTYVMKAKKLELLEAHAKQYLKDAQSNDNDSSELTVRQFQANILGMCERNVTNFKTIINHPEKDTYLDMMDKGFMSLNKAAACARGEKNNIPKPKSNIKVGQIPVLTCEDCPNKERFEKQIEDYGDAPKSEKESEVANA